METNTTTFSIGGALSWGWEQFKARPWFFIGVMLLVFVITAALGALADEKIVGEGVMGVAAGLLSTIVQWWIYIGMIGLLLAAYDGKTLSVSQLFEQEGRTLLHYALGTILYTLIIIGGFILLVFPAVIWGIKYHYYAYLIVDKGMKPVDALKRSAEITKGHKWTIFGFFLVVGLIGLAGALALFVGLLVAIPITLLASVYVYRWLEGTAVVSPELAPQEQN